MAKLFKRTNYRRMYPGIGDEIIEVLEKSDRKIEYQQYDLKVERYRVDTTMQAISYISSREDSYEQLLEENRQFVDESESVEDTAVKRIKIEKMLSCLKMLTNEEQKLINELFFKGKSEHRLSKEMGIPRMTLHDRKVKILCNLKKAIEK